MRNIIIVHLFQPSSAATNRIIAYVKSFTELGKKATLILGCDNESPLPVLENVEVICVTAPVHQLLVPKMAIEVKHRYTKESAILVYGSPLLCLFLPKWRYNIFFECTEVPLYGKSKGFWLKLKESFKLHLAKRATGMFVISNALKEYYSQRGIKSIAVINMFVDASRFDIVVPDSEEKYVAYCGTVSLFKDGVDCLIKAFHIFHEFHNDYKLKIIGRFENNNSEQEVQALVKNFALDETIQFTGLVSPENMPKLLKGAAMLALARPNNIQAQYGFPTKLGEYLATGNPVVVTNVGEIGDFLRDGENCRMAFPSNVEDFAKKMIWVADHLDEARAIGMKGKELTKNEFLALEQSRKALIFMANVIDN